MLELDACILLLVPMLYQVEQYAPHHLLLNHMDYVNVIHIIHVLGVVCVLDLRYLKEDKHGCPW